MLFYFFRGYLNWLSGPSTRKKAKRSQAVTKGSGSEQKRQREALAGSVSGKGAVKNHKVSRESVIRCEQWRLLERLVWMLQRQNVDVNSGE